ncbi:cache domain-containing protein [Methanorbis rubei]|uniref:Cache domain-containing protein n=1 Tax=Methanorbis rubei TaxID=3028300 RepID=A0AAE4MHA3_9EURY|nr:hypothetical protein [Methanocorpusculaceae archaeon Cs1]
MNRKIVIGLEVALLAVVAVFSAACILPESDEAFEQKYAKQMEATRSLADSMTKIQLSYLDMIQPGAERIAGDPDNTTQTTAILSEIYSSMPSFSVVAFVNETGHVTTVFPANYRDIVIGNWTDHLNRYHTDQTITFDKFNLRNHSVPGIVIHSGPETTGYVTALIDTSHYFGEVRSEYADAADWQYWLVADDGFILHSPYSELSGKNMRDLNTPDRAGLYRVFGQALGNTSGMAVYTGYSYSDLKPMNYVVTWDTVPIGHTGDQKLLVMITAKQNSRQNLVRAVPSTDQTLEEFVHSALIFVDEVGKDAALAEFSDPNGRFTTQEYSIFAFDRNKTMLADAYDHSLLGNPISYAVDSNGVEAGDLIHKRAMQGGGYVAYLYPNPAENMTEQLKLSYIVQVDDDWYIAAGSFGNYSNLHVPAEVRENITSYLRSVQTYAQSVDKDTAIATLNDPVGSYAPRNNMRFFAMDYNGTTLADPQYPQFVGENYLGMTDILGGSITRDAIILAKDGGGKQYVYTPKETTGGAYELRLEYILPAGDDWLILGAVTIA